MSRLVKKKRSLRAKPAGRAQNVLLQISVKHVFQKKIGSQISTGEVLQAAAATGGNDHSFVPIGYKSRLHSCLP